ncbi:MAG: tyrosine--tRNA ligase [Candidatus Omnitrophota bacterium]|nr:tyrosine--tRNA ligase [Candidatus Omnitrophota bacterium]
MEKNIDKQLELIRRGTVEIIQLEELKKKLDNAIKTNKPLVVKAGFDPTAPDIHLGHTVLLRKLRHFQDLGHKVIFLIGDATALVGDPSGQSQTRKVLPIEEVDRNSRTYVNQAKRILREDPRLLEIKHNRDWFIKPFSGNGEHPFGFEQFIELAQKYTVARLLERDDFEKRLKENRPISYSELFYPLMQGYDSVKLRSDIEVGGTDQKFNMLVGRDLQGSYGQNPQVVITMPLLEGLDGVNKMSKSLGNYVGINETAKDTFGKLMSVSDELMWKYYELLTDENVEKVKAEVNAGKLHPKQAKVNLAAIITAQYHGKTEADKQIEEFDRAFKDKGFPQDINLTEVQIQGDKAVITEVLSDLSKLLSSKGEAKRKIQEGAVEVDGARISDVNLGLPAGREYKIRVGKKFARISLKNFPQGLR